MSVSRSDLNNPSEPKVRHFPISQELNRIQYGRVTKYIFIEQLPIGFGGQISGRLLALKLALALDRKAVFSSHADPPYLQTFEPQYSNAPTNMDWSAVDLFDPLLQQEAAFLRFNYLTAVNAWIRLRIELRIGSTVNLSNDTASIVTQMLRARSSRGCACCRQPSRWSMPRKSG